jgi:hypothetical protein
VRRGLALFASAKISAWLAAPTALTISKIRLRTRASRIVQARTSNPPTITTEMMNLCSLVEKTPDADVRRDMIASAAKRLMEIGADYRGAQRAEQRVARARAVRLHTHSRGIFVHRFEQTIHIVVQNPARVGGAALTCEN